MSRSPLLILGCGNPSRGDDALGSELLQWLENERDAGNLPAGFDIVTDFQLQIEHALDLEGRRLVLFVDAGVNTEPPFEFSNLQPERDTSYTSHAVSPASLLTVYSQISDRPLPACFLLLLAGSRFELGTPLSGAAKASLAASKSFVKQLLHAPDAQDWNQSAEMFKKQGK